MIGRHTNFDYSVIIAHSTHFRENLVPVTQVAQGHKKEDTNAPLIYSSEFYTKEGTEVLENATILFAFVCLFRQQIKPLYPVET